MGYSFSYTVIVAIALRLKIGNSIEYARCMVVKEPNEVNVLHSLLQSAKLLSGFYRKKVKQK